MNSVCEKKLPTSIFNLFYCTFRVSFPIINDTLRGITQNIEIELDFRSLFFFILF